MKPNTQDMQVAYKLWIELSTRKIGLPIDPDNDVVTEIYDSWYEFFQITRDLIKEVPVAKVRRNRSTRDLVRVAMDVLNVGMRPHLTKWQARFRQWHAAQLQVASNRDKPPQDLQREFPSYDELITDMQAVNIALISYRGIMGHLATGATSSSSVAP